MVDIVWLVLWAIVGWLFGVLFYIIGGLSVHAIPDRLSENKASIQNKVANHYSQIALKLLGRAVLVERGTKYDIYKSKHEPEKTGDKFTMDGETAHAVNDTGLLSTLSKVPFGMVAPPDDNVSSYVSPELGELGEIETLRKENGTLRDDDGQYIDEVELPQRRPLVKLQEFARRMIPGDRSLYDLEETEDLYKQSQSGFAESRKAQYMILVIAYAVSSGVAYLIMSQTTGEGTSVTMPIQIMGAFL